MSDVKPSAFRVKLLGLVDSGAVYLRWRVTASWTWCNSAGEQWPNGYGQALNLFVNTGLVDMGPSLNEVPKPVRLAKLTPRGAELLREWRGDR